MDTKKNRPAMLACGCLEQVVRDRAHQCERFSGMKADAYPWIIVWGAYLGSSVNFIQDARDRAQRDGAPLDAYRELLDDGARTGHWVTVEEMSVLTRTRVGLPPQPERED